jgi:hypothetical protein
VALSVTVMPVSSQTTSCFLFGDKNVEAELIAFVINSFCFSTLASSNAAPFS